RRTYNMQDKSCQDQAFNCNIFPPADESKRLNRRDRWKEWDYPSCALPLGSKGIAFNPCASRQCRPTTGKYKIWELAEGVGFEPTVGCPTLDFESSALNRTQPPFHFF